MHLPVILSCREEAQGLTCGEGNSSDQLELQCLLTPCGEMFSMRPVNTAIRELDDRSRQCYTDFSLVTLIRLVFSILLK